MAHNLSRQLLHDIAPQTKTESAPSSSLTDTRCSTNKAIVLPSRDTAIERVQEVIQETPELRRDLITQLRQALAVGTLVLDSQALADKLIGMQLHDTRSAA